jgi:hypothetical protein
VADPTVADSTCTECGKIKDKPDDACGFCDLFRPEQEPEPLRSPVPVSTYEQIAETNNARLVASLVELWRRREVEGVRPMLAEQPGDLLGSLFAEAMRRQEPYAWISLTVRDAIIERLIKQRTASVDKTGTVAIPHPEVVMEAAAQFEKYAPDADELIGLLPALSPSDAADLRAQLVDAWEQPSWTEVIDHPAEDVPAKFKSTGIPTLKRLGKKYRETAVGKILEKQLQRTPKADKFTIDVAVRKDNV